MRTGQNKAILLRKRCVASNPVTEKKVTCNPQRTAITIADVGPMLMWVIVYPSRVPGTLICTMSFRGGDAGAAACLAVMGRVGPEIRTVIDMLRPPAELRGMLGHRRSRKRTPLNREMAVGGADCAARTGTDLGAVKLAQPGGLL